jgi:hypothetical protein
MIEESCPRRLSTVIWTRPLSRTIASEVSFTVTGGLSVSAIAWVASQGKMTIAEALLLRNSRRVSGIG